MKRLLKKYLPGHSFDFFFHTLLSVLKVGLVKKNTHMGIIFTHAESTH